MEMYVPKIEMSRNFRPLIMEQFPLETHLRTFPSHLTQASSQPYLNFPNGINLNVIIFFSMNLSFILCRFFEFMGTINEVFTF